MSEQEQSTSRFAPNIEHVAILREGAEKWNTWREDHLEVRPDLKGAHLKGADLDGAHLEGANLMGAHLEGAILKHASLEEADLRKCVGLRLDSSNTRNSRAS